MDEEAVLDAMTDAYGGGPRGRKQSRDAMVVVWQAAKKEMERQGHKVLPREPTEDMHVAMRDSAACQPDPPDGCLFFPDAAWRSGWDAS